MKLPFFSAKRACLAMTLVMCLFALPMSGPMAQSVHRDAPAGVIITVEIEDISYRPVPSSGADIIVSPNPASTSVLADPDSGLTISGLLILDESANLLESEDVNMPDEFIFELPTGRLLFRFDTSDGIIDKWVIIE